MDTQSYQKAAQAVGFGQFSQGQATNAINQPRELRLAERLSGIEGGLSELVGKLNEAHQRLSPFPESKCDTSAQPVDGIKHAVTRIELALHEANSLANGLITAL